MTQVLEIQEQDYTFIGKGSNFSGILQFNGPTRLAGHIEGELTMRGDFSLVIEREGTFKGTLKCHRIEIYGSFQGSLQSLDAVIVYPSGKVTGDIIAENLVIHPGALINIEGKTALH